MEKIISLLKAAIVCVAPPLLRQIHRHVSRFAFCRTFGGATKRTNASDVAFMGLWGHGTMRVKCGERWESGREAA